MSKRVLTVAAITSALIILALASNIQINFVSANPIGMTMPWDPKPVIIIVSPQNNSKLSSTNYEPVTLTFTINLSQWYNYYTPYNPTYTFTLKPIEYYLFGNFLGQLVGNVTKDVYTISVPLMGLTEGQYYVEVIAKTSGKYYNRTYERGELVARVIDGETVGSSGKIYFKVNVPPKVTLTSIENKTYFGSEVVLTFLVDKSISRFTYSLDDQTNRTIWENTTLTNLQVGSHSVKVYAIAWDDPENVGASETVTFTIAAQATPTPSESPQPTPTNAPTPNLSPSSAITQQPKPVQSATSQPTEQHWQFPAAPVELTLLSVLLLVAALAMFLLRRKEPNTT